MPDLESIVARAGASGWDFFEKLPKDLRERVELKQAADDEKKRVIAHAWARFAASPDGAQALELLFDSTLNRTVFFVNLGQPAVEMAMWGSFREGQNALAFSIARQIAIGRADDEQPKPRETL